MSKVQLGERIRPLEDEVDELNSHALAETPLTRFNPFLPIKGEASKSKFPRIRRLAGSKHTQIAQFPVAVCAVMERIMSCVVCGKPLRGQQNRFCSVECQLAWKRREQRKKREARRLGSGVTPHTCRCDLDGPCSRRLSRALRRRR